MRAFITIRKWYELIHYIKPAIDYELRDFLGWPRDKKKIGQKIEPNNRFDFLTHYSYLVGALEWFLTLCRKSRILANAIWKKFQYSTMKAKITPDNTRILIFCPEYSYLGLINIRALASSRFMAKKLTRTPFPNSEESNESFRLLKEESLVQQDSLIPLIWNIIRCQLGAKYIFLAPVWYMIYLNSDSRIFILSICLPYCIWICRRVWIRRILIFDAVISFCRADLRDFTNGWEKHAAWEQQRNE